MIIERPMEAKRIRETPKWTLVYGRRKTGKSFLVERSVPWNEYYFVKQDRTILSKRNNKSISYEAFLEILKQNLEMKKIIVIDEFHRLGNDFFDLLHASEKQGRLIVVSSTLFLAHRLLGSKSPLLGIFAEIPIGLIKLNDALSALRDFTGEKKQRLELALFMREPILVDYVSDKTTARNAFATVLQTSARTVPAFVGEIFTEEQRTTSAIYEGILRAIANGKTNSAHISSYLFARKLLQKDDPSVIQRHLDNLVQFGIIKKIKVFEKNKFAYRHVSPLCWLYYYADEKYNVSETNFTEEEATRVVDEVLPHIMEDNLREFIAERLGLRESISEASDFEVDGILLRFTKPELAMEVKWKTKITNEDLEKAEKNLEKINAKQKLIFVPDKTQVQYHGKAKIVDISDFA